MAYTDGVTEALNGEWQEFGEHRLQALVAPSPTASEICHRLANGLMTFIGNTAQWDDITVAVLKVRKKKADD